MVCLTVASSSFMFVFVGHANAEKMDFSAVLSLVNLKLGSDIWVIRRVWPGVSKGAEDGRRPTVGRRGVWHGEP
jgi:hypothetical protein